MASFFRIKHAAIGENSDLIFPIQKGREKDGIIITNNGISVFDQKPSELQVGKSWSTKVEEKFTCPVVYNRTSNQYVAVQRETVIQLWPETENHLENAEKHEVFSPIECLLDVGEDILVLYKYGDCTTLSTALSTKDKEKEVYINQNEVMVGVSRQDLGNSHLISIITAKKEGGLHFHQLNVDKESGFATSHDHQSISNYDTSFVGCCTVTLENKDLFLVLWSNGDLYHYSYGKNSYLLLNAGSEKKNYFGIVGLKNSSVALLVEQDGAFILEIWDVIYGTIKETLALPPDVTPDSRLGYVDPNIYLTTKKSGGVLAFPLAPPPSRLAEAALRHHNKRISSAYPVKVKKRKKNNHAFDGSLPKENLLTQIGPILRLKAPSPLKQQEALSFLSESAIQMLSQREQVQAILMCAHFEESAFPLPKPNGVNFAHCHHPEALAKPIFIKKLLKSIKLDLKQLSGFLYELITVQDCSPLLDLFTKIFQLAESSDYVLIEQAVLWTRALISTFFFQLEKIRDPVFRETLDKLLDLVKNLSTSVWPYHPRVKQTSGDGGWLEPSNCFALQ